MVNISSNAVYSFINYLHILGIERTQCFELINLTEQKLNQQKLVDIKHYQALYSHANGLLNIKNLGFKYGQHIHTDRWGVLGQIVFTSPTIEVALANQRRYQSIAGSLGTPSYTIENNRVTLKWLPAIENSDQLAEELITSWIEFARRLTTHTTSPFYVFFSHSCLTTQAEYQDYFNCPVRFNHDFTGLVISKDLLKSASSGVNLELNKTLTKYADLLLSEHSIQNPVEVTTDFIATQLPYKKPSLQNISAYLNVSERTLQRRLNELSTSFSELVDNVKRDIAINYLTHSQISLNDISELLGFSELSAFNRAFKRWKKTSPAKFRKAINKN
jgi:AraC-like DNA-binding protein